MRSKFLPLIFAVLGLAVGYGVHSFASFLATVAIKVRPGLADLSFVEALFSGHFFEWLWYLYGPYLLWPTIIVFGVIGAVIGLWLSD